jgi:ribose transport system substrate-binding protein
MLRSFERASSRTVIFRVAIMSAVGMTLTGCGGSDGGAGGDTDTAPAATDGAESSVKLHTVPEGESIDLAYVTNGIDPFWTIAAAGVKAAANDLDVNAEVLMPPKGVVDQKRMMENALARGIDGMAISPIDAANQVAFINQAAKVTNVITQDSDAPDANRLCFIGMDNYKAGREAGKLIKEVIPDGGKVMIFVGRLEQLNAQQRRQGVIDELIDAPMQDGNNLNVSPPSTPIKGDKYVIISTLTDNFDYAKAKSNAEDAMSANPDLACMVGLFAYNIPNCLQAVEGAGKLNQIKMVSFDEADDTLAAIAAGTVHGTVSQQPFEYGYQSIRILKGLAQGDASVLPEGGTLEVPVVLVRKANVEEFTAKLAELKALGA